MRLLSKQGAFTPGTVCAHRCIELLLLALLLGLPMSVQAQNNRTVSGTITLSGLDSSAAAQPIRLKFWASDNTTEVRDVTIGPAGTFSVSSLPAKAFTLSIKGAKWLRKNVTVNTTTGNVTNVAATLIPGDANNDNGVDILDLDVLIQAFDACLGDGNYDSRADFTCDTCVDVFDLDLLIQNFDQVGDTDPAPPLLGFTLPTTAQGGQSITGTATFSEPVTAGASLTITCSPVAAVAVPGSNPSIVTLTGDASAPYQNSFSLNTSTVNYPTRVTVFATYEQTTLKATTTLTPVNFRVVWLKPDGSNICVHLAWNAYSTSNNLLIKRTVNSQTTTIATLSGSASSYDDTFDYFAYTPANADCKYELIEDMPSPTDDKLLATEKVKFYRADAEANQAVDARYDPRFSTYTHLDFNFGNRTYMGGLFAGYADPPDNSRMGRSFARFPLTGSYTNLAFRCGTVNAYFMGLFKRDKRSSASYSPTSVDVYAQPLSDPGVDSLDVPALVWSTALPYVDLNAADRQAVGVGVATGKVQPNHWAMWDFSQVIRETLRTNDQDDKLTMAWTGQSDTTVGWAYFAKKEYNTALAPTVLHAWTYPTPIKIEFRDASGNVLTQVNRNTVGVKLWIMMNGIGVGDSVTVTCEKAINNGVFSANGTFDVSGLQNSFPFDTSLIGQSITVTYKISCNGVSATASLLIL